MCSARQLGQNRNQKFLVRSLTWIHDRPYDLDNTYMALAAGMLLQHVIKDAHNIRYATATSYKDGS